MGANSSSPPSPDRMPRAVPYDDVGAVRFEGRTPSHGTIDVDDTRERIYKVLTCTLCAERRARDLELEVRRMRALKHEAALDGICEALLARQRVPPPVRVVYGTAV